MLVMPLFDHGTVLSRSLMFVLVLSFPPPERQIVADCSRLAMAAFSATIVCLIWPDSRRFDSAWRTRVSARRVCSSRTCWRSESP